MWLLLLPRKRHHAGGKKAGSSRSNGIPAVLSLVSTLSFNSLATVCSGLKHAIVFSWFTLRVARNAITTAFTVGLCAWAVCFFLCHLHQRFSSQYSLQLKGVLGVLVALPPRLFRALLPGVRVHIALGRPVIHFAKTGKAGG